MQYNRLMEIERKWLIKSENIPYDLASLPCEEMEQAYITFSPTIRIRRINGGQCNVMTIKTSPLSGDGSLAREEHEFPIPSRDYDALLPLTKGRIIRKKRYIHELSSGLKEEIDVFCGELEGLAYLEIEFPDVESATAYPDPVWVEKDVTYLYEYKNASLAQNGIPV